MGPGRPADVLVQEGVIERIGPDLRADPAAEVVDVPGRLLLPGLIDAHCHVDKTLFGGRWVPHSAGPALADRIAEEHRRRGELGLPNVEHMTALLEQMVASGTTHVRTHTDVVTDHGLAGVEAVWAARERLGGRVTIEQVAFPQYGVLADTGTAELLDEALSNGVEVIGGIDPAGADRDPVRHLDIVFALAEKHDAGLDIHLHDGGSLGTWPLELIIERTRATGLGGRVAVSHAYGLAQADQATQDRLGRQLADAGVSLVTAAAYNFPVPPIARLRAAGVTIACGHDGIRDLWSPFGSGDMLERAMHLAYRSTFRRDEEIEMALDAATYGGARALGLHAYGLEPGARADIVVVNASTPAEAVVTHPVRDLVVKAAASSHGREHSSDRPPGRPDATDRRILIVLTSELHITSWPAPELSQAFFAGGCITAELHPAGNTAAFTGEASSALGFTTRRSLQQTLDARSSGRLQLDPGHNTMTGAIAQTAGQDPEAARRRHGYRSQGSG